MSAAVLSSIQNGRSNLVTEKPDISRYEFDTPMEYLSDYIELTNINKPHFVLGGGYKKGTLFRKVMNDLTGCSIFEVYRFSGQRPWDALLFLDDGRPFVIKGREGRPSEEPIYLYTKPGTLERTVISGAGIEILDENELIAELTDTTSRLCCKDPNTGECVQTGCTNLPEGVLINELAGFQTVGRESYRSVPGAHTRLTNLPHGAILQITTNKHSDGNYGPSNWPAKYYNVYNTYPLSEQRTLLFHDDGAPIHITSPISGQGVFTSFIPPVKNYTIPSQEVYYPIKNTNGDKFKFIDINGDVIFDLYPPALEEDIALEEDPNKTFIEQHGIKLFAFALILISILVVYIYIRR